MGKKLISSKKHKKLKSVDPFYKGERRHLINKGSKKANCKPNKPNVQEVPRKMLELFEKSQLINDGKINMKKKRKKKEFSKFYENPADVVEGMPIFERLPGENNFDLLKRVERLSQEVIQEFRMREKHDHRSGEQILDAAEEIGEDHNAERKEEKMEILAGNKKLPSKAKQKKRKIYEAKKKEKKLTMIENRKGDFDHLKDEIKFGEVILQPPCLSAKPRKSQNSTSINKPGKKNLLLKNLLNPNEINKMKKEINLSARGVLSTVDRTVKRKLLTVADRRKLDEERDKAVFAYRALRNRQQVISKAERKRKADAELVKKSSIKI